MATVKNIKIGSTDTEYNKKVQQALVDKGYGDIVGKVDGVIGPKTDAAIRKFQEDNKLQKDGIAGVKTQALLFADDSNTGGNTNTNNNKNNAGSNKIVDGGAKEPVAGTPKVEEAKIVTSPGGFTYGDFQYQSFDPMADEQVKQAWDILQQNSASQPGAWVDQYQDQWMGYLNQYENRDPFSYDFNKDALYQQYKDQYIQQGQLAMMDTMGQAAAMTGGYGNSYAQTVGQQAYNQQLSQLNEIMPELYGMAYDRYTQEGQDLLNQYSIYKGLSEESYSQHQDSLENWYRENTRLQGNYDTLYGQAYDNYMLGYNTALNEYNTDRSENFTISENEKTRADNKQTNAKSDLINLITGTGYKPTDEELAEAGMTRDQANSYAKAYTTSSESSTTNDTTKYTALDYEEQQKWDKEFSKAESINDVDRIADRMEQAGVDPKVVADWRDYYAKQFEDEKPADTPVKNDISHTTPVGGGGGGGRNVYMVR